VLCATEFHSNRAQLEDNRRQFLHHSLSERSTPFVSLERARDGVIESEGGKDTARLKAQLPRGMQRSADKAEAIRLIDSRSLSLGGLKGAKVFVSIGENCAFSLPNFDFHSRADQLFSPCSTISRLARLSIISYSPKISVN
jgi:hypothetical protein